MKLIGLMVIAFIIVIGAISMQSMYTAVDYEASNRTGNMTDTTNETVASYSIQSEWWWGVVILIMILTVLGVFRVFVK
jgi:heme/copper-type cytochrome/quinol oxidase subunit 2